MNMRAALLMAAILIAGCADPQKDWELAARDDSPETYLEFLAKYPDSEQADLARARIQALKVIRAWERADFKNSEAAYANFIAKHPDSEFVAEAESRINAIRRDRQWEQIGEDVSAQALEEFIASYPAAPQRVEAERMLADIRAAELAAIAAATPKERSGAFRLQLAAFRTPAAAERELRRLVKLFPDAFFGPLRIETPADRRNDSGMFLVKTVPMSGAEARDVCERLRRRQQQCMIINR